MTKLAGKAKARNRKAKQKAKARNSRNFRAKYVSMIRKYDDPILSQVSTDLMQEDDLGFITSMKRAILGTSYGVGLAASQLGVLKRVCLVSNPENRVGTLRVLINPVVIEKSETEEVGIEGCLSYPKTYGTVSRPMKIKVKFLTEKWTPKTEEFDGIVARVVMHELDHLDGICAISKFYKKGRGV